MSVASASSPADSSPGQKLQPKLNEEEELERQYQEYKGQFESWKLKNKHLESTATFQQYVNQFGEWEKEVEKRRELIRQRKKFIPIGTASHHQIQRPDSSSSSSRQSPTQEEPTQQAPSQLTQQDMPTSTRTETGGSMDPFTFMMGMMSMMFDPTMMMGMMGSDAPPPPPSGDPQRDRDVAIRAERSRPEPLPTLGPEYGYGGSQGMWGGHDNDDRLFRRWGHRADPPDRGPPPWDPYKQYPPPPGAIIPPGWVTGNPIRKEHRMPPPPRDYRGGRPAFKDFSMR